MKTNTPRPIRLRDYTAPTHLIDRTDLNVDLNPTATRVIAKLKVRPNPDADAPSDTLVLDGEALDLVEVKLNKRVLNADDYAQSPTALTLSSLPDEPFELTVTTVINPDANQALQGLYRTNGIYCTQCEAQGFRRITYYLDRPDVLSVFSCRIEANVDDAPILLSNGNPRERGSAATVDGVKRHYAIWKDPHPKPSYLFALVAGNLSSIASDFTTASGEHVDLRIYVEPGKEDRCGWAMDSLKRSMRWDETRYGREYDLDVFNIVAVSDFNMGAMENKGLNVFNDRLILASADTATDQIYEAIESVIAHEYFHNWTGNRITCRDWFQLCLKEGLTVYRDQEFSADERSRPVQRISDVRRLRAHQFPEDAGPLSHPVRPSSYIEINNFYTATVYEKGAELVRMISTIVGDDAFGAGLDLYFERHDGDAATIEQFLACFEEAGGQSLAQFMLWYEQAGTPEVMCKLTWDKARKTATLALEQSQAPTPGQTRKRPLQIPLRIGLIGRDGAELPLTLANGKTVPDGVVQLTRASQNVRFKNVTEKPTLSVLRGFSAPVKLVRDITERQLAFLMAHDQDPFARWQASADYAMRLLLAQIPRGDDTEPLSARIADFAAALEMAITSDDNEPAYCAELLRLPSESDIAREIGRNVDPTGIHIARKAIATAIAIQLGATLADLYAASRISEAYDPGAEQAGRRALRNACLSLLTLRNRRDDRERLSDHYWQANNMTDQAHALTLYAHSTKRERQTALDDFHDRWQDDHLVIDTWFSVQATAPQNAALARTRKLTRHPRYSATTPNKIRAVVGAFAMGNPVQFNRPDGKGYDFVVEQILATDRFNPQVAARLLGAFRSWRTLERSRRGLAKGALMRIAAAPTLSRDVYEIANRILGIDP